MLSFYPTMIHHNGPLAVLESLFNHFLALHTLSKHPYRLILTYGSPDPQDLCPLPPNSSK